MKLEGEGAGRWLVEPVTARHLVDLDRGVVTRCPEDDPSVEGFTCADLRRDDEELQLFALVKCEMGAPIVMLIEVLPGVTTVRTSTPVLRITRLDESEAEEATFPDALSRG